MLKHELRTSYGKTKMRKVAGLPAEASGEGGGDNLCNLPAGRQVCG
jgi:hypothetical protein